MNIFFLLLLTGVITWFMKLQTRHVHFLHMAQLEKYQINDYASWISRNKKHLPDYKEIYLSVVLVITGLSCFYLDLKRAEILLIVLWIAGTAYLYLKREKTEQKKKLVFTPRATRLFLVTNVLFLYLVFDMLSRIYSSSQYAALLVIFVIISTQIMYQITFYFVLLGIFINYPVEAAVNKYYLRSARRIIQESDATVIGITGSYGKTSVKDILHALLSVKYKVLKTPESYNTPMGICKVIRGDLEADHNFFVVEMGARRRGEIRELCELVQPVTGIVTSIGPQHLETFGSLQNIAETKFELINALPSDGTAVINGENPICMETLNKIDVREAIIFGADFDESKIPQKQGVVYLFVGAKNMSVDSSGCSFILQYGNSEIEVKSRLLGYANIYNILAASATALHYGLTLREIKDAIKDLKPTPHRLQLIKNAKGITIIDDAFNSNPVGAKIALDVLKSFEGGRKILVTPGFVELGEIEYEENKKLGEMAAEACDYVIVVGDTQAKPIIDGLEGKSFSPDKIINVQSLDKASECLQAILKPKDVVLFENDLPDNYI